MWAARNFYFSRLHEFSPSSHDVYLVSLAPTGDVWTLPEVVHWSVYTQGHFYHLGAGRENGFAVPSGPPILGQVVKLKDGGYTGKRDGKQPEENFKPLVAYHIGQTDHPPSDILDVGKQIINDVPSYNALVRNCQHFITTLKLNILTGLPFRYVFIGTASQIANWDLRPSS